MGYAGDYPVFIYTTNELISLLIIPYKCVFSDNQLDMDLAKWVLA